MRTKKTGHWGENIEENDIKYLREDSTKKVWIGFTSIQTPDEALDEIKKKIFLASAYIAEGIKYKDIMAYVPKKIRITIEVL